MGAVAGRLLSEGDQDDDQTQRANGDSLTERPSSWPPVRDYLGGQTQHQ